MNEHRTGKSTAQTPSLNRREMLRAVAAGMVMTAVSRRSAAELCVPTLDVDARCKRGITLLRPRNGAGPGMTMQQLLYNPLLFNMDWFIDNATHYQSSNDCHRLPGIDALVTPLTNLKNALDALTGAGRLRPLRDFYLLDFPAEYTQSVRGPFRAVGALCASPHLTLPNKAAGNPHRRDAVALLDSPTFKNALLNEEVYKLFTFNRDDHLDANIDPHKYLLARGAFDFGVFHEKGRPIPLESGQPARPKREVSENGKCWSESSQACVTGNEDDYCQTDNGEPTTSSDVCS